MERLMRGRTVFMIAHRLTTLEPCDRILVIEGGRLVETARDVSGARERVHAGAGDGAREPR
jgi:ATP-binding cassette subfamily B protein